MTTSDSSSSDKKVYVECISSEVYLTVSPERRNVIEHMANSNDGKLPLGSQTFKYSCGTAYSMHNAFSGNIKAKLKEKYREEGPVYYIPAYTEIKITYLEALNLLDRANALVLETDEGIRARAGQRLRGGLTDHDSRTGNRVHSFGHLPRFPPIFNSKTILFVLRSYRRASISLCCKSLYL